IRFAGSGGIVCQPGCQRLGGLGAYWIPAALPIVLVGVAAFGAAAAFGFEVVDGNGDAIVSILQAEGLGQGLTVQLVERGCAQGGGIANGLDTVGAVEQANGNVIITQLCQTGIDPLPLGTQRPGQFGNGAVLAVAVILNFHQADDVGIKGDQSADQFLDRKSTRLNSSHVKI